MLLSRGGTREITSEAAAATERSSSNSSSSCCCHNNNSSNTQHHRHFQDLCFVPLKLYFIFFLFRSTFLALFFFGQLSSCNFLAARCSLIAIVTMCRGRVRVACLAHKVTWRKFALCALKHLCVCLCVCEGVLFLHLSVDTFDDFWVQQFTFSLPLYLLKTNDLSRLKLSYGTRSKQST